MPRRILAAAVSFAVVPAASAEIFIEIAPLSTGPDGADSIEAIIGEPETLGIWIWSDEPRVVVESIGFDIDGTVTVFDPTGGNFRFDGVGVPDPGGRFTLFTSAGVLANPNLVDNVELVSLFDPVAIPGSIDRALLIYTDLVGTPLEVGSGVLPMINFLDTMDGMRTATVYGWYQIPTAPTGAILAAAGTLAIRRRRAG